MCFKLFVSSRIIFQQIGLFFLKWPHIQHKIFNGNSIGRSENLERPKVWSAEPTDSADPIRYIIRSLDYV